MKTLRRLLPLALVLLLPGCASTSPPGPAEGVKDTGFYEERVPELDFMDVSDPLEPFNRSAYRFNQQFDRFVFLPAVRVYRILPGFVRTGVNNAVNNLYEVRNASASLLQGKVGKTGRSVARFVLNSTVGIAGLIDVASMEGIAPVKEDFGQVLGAWGVPQGPYLVIPVLGPSNARDVVGRALDETLMVVVDPAGVIDERRDHLGYAALFALQTRDSIPFRYGQLRSPFEYEIVRYAFTQAREIQIAE